MSVVEASPNNIDLAAQAINNGLLVGMPTETVYGIAANAFDESAVRATFDLKGRPQENPLIVHVASVDQARDLALTWPAVAEQLAQRFWPGPMTLVVKKRPIVHDLVTGGLDTVAVRMPAHPVAIDFIRVCGSPLTAPSANRFQSLSPTSAGAITPAIAQGLHVILDGGPCDVGIESCVLDLSGSTPTVLRPGSISEAEIEAALGRELGSDSLRDRRSPGLYRKHYAPITPVRLVEKLTPTMPGIGFSSAGPHQIALVLDASEYARYLYASLRELDSRGYPEIFVELPPASPEWGAIHDRLCKAASSADLAD